MGSLFWEPTIQEDFTDVYRQAGFQNEGPNVDSKYYNPQKETPKSICSKDLLYFGVKAQGRHVETPMPPNP